MKIKNAFIGLAFTLLLAGGAIGLKNNNSEEVVKADDSDYADFYLETTSANWEISDAELYLVCYDKRFEEPNRWNYHELRRYNYHLYIVEANISQVTGYRFVRVNPDAEFDYNGDPDGYSSDVIWNKTPWTDIDLSKKYCTLTDWWNGTWSNNEPVEVTLTASFAEGSEVPVYAELCAMGDFNGWSNYTSDCKMTRVDERNFTYKTKIAHGQSTYEYKLAACYVGDDQCDWTHEIDTGSNKQVTLSASSVSPVVLGNPRVYDFASNMPDEYVLDGTKIVFSTYSIPETVNLYFVSSLTNWCVSKESLDAAKMVRTESGSKYTYNVPNGTHVGYYDYKVVVLPAGGDETAIRYETDAAILVGSLQANETIQLINTISTYQFNTIYQDLSSLEAIGFAQTFTKAMEEVCVDENADNKDAVSAIWSNWKTLYNLRTSSSAKQLFKTSNHDAIVRARKTYLHVVYTRNYGLTAWDNAPTLSVSTNPISSSMDVALLITFISLSSLIAISGLIILKKKKEEK